MELLLVYEAVAVLVPCAGGFSAGSAGGFSASAPRFAPTSGSVAEAEANAEFKAEAEVAARAA